MPSTGTFSWRNMRDRAGRVEQGDFLRRADDDGAGQRQRLRQGQRYVAGSRGQVDHQVVERAPVDLAEKLLDDAVEHRPAHDDRALGLEQEAHRHQLESAGLDRLDALAAGHRPAAGADQVGDRRAVDVGVHQPDAGSVGTQAIGDGRGHRRLADPPFPEPTAITFLMPGISPVSTIPLPRTSAPIVM